MTTQQGGTLALERLGSHAGSAVSARVHTRSVPDWLGVAEFGRNGAGSLMGRIPLR